MNTQEAPSQNVIKALMSMAVLYDKNLTPEAATMLVDDLSNYEEGKILGALKLCRLELGKFPTTAEIIKRISVKSEQNQTQEIVGRIYAAISLYGYMNHEGARMHIGEVGWRAVMNFGGWMKVCDYPEENDMALRSQLNRAVESCVALKLRSDSLGIAFVGAEEVVRPLEHSPMKGLVFNMEDFKPKVNE